MHYLLLSYPLAKLASLKFARCLGHGEKVVLVSILVIGQQPLLTAQLGSQEPERS